MPTVSWQSAFWALVPPALNSMTQPCGRVCGYSARFRIYLRSSPVTCAVDTLDVFMRISTLWLSGIPFRKSCYTVKANRFDESDFQHEGLQALGKRAWERWILFGLGTLPQVIKLLSMNGIPLTQALGMTYLFSFLVFELLFILTPG